MTEDSDEPPAPVKDKYWYLPVLFTLLIVLYFFLTAHLPSSVEPGAQDTGIAHWKIRANIAFCSGEDILTSTTIQAFGYILFAGPALIMIYKRTGIVRAIAAGGIFTSVLLTVVVIPSSVIAFTICLDYIISNTGNLREYSSLANVMLMEGFYLLGFVIFAQMAMMVFDTVMRLLSNRADAIFSGLLGMLLLVAVVASPIILLGILIYIPHPLTDNYNTGEGYNKDLFELVQFGLSYLSLMTMVVGWYAKKLSRLAALTAISCAIFVLVGASLASGLGVVKDLCF